MLYLMGVPAATGRRASPWWAAAIPTPQGLANARQFARSFAAGRVQRGVGPGAGRGRRRARRRAGGRRSGPARHHRRGGHRAGPRLSAPAPGAGAPHRAARTAGQRVSDRHAAAGGQFPEAQPDHRGAEPGHGGGGGRAAVGIADHRPPGGGTRQGRVRDSRLHPFAAIARLPCLAQAGRQAGRDGPGRAGGHCGCPSADRLRPAARTGGRSRRCRRRKTPCCRPWASIR